MPLLDVSYGHLTDTLIAVSHGFIAVMLLFIYKEMRRVATANARLKREIEERQNHKHSRTGDPPKVFGQHRAGDVDG